MKYKKISTKRLIFLASSMSTMMLANATQFEPATAPIFSIPQAKPNIHMLLDDSASMRSVDVIAPEHTFGFGQPVCQNQSQQWHEERIRLNEYDPFKDGKYVPWDDTKADSEGLIGGKKKPPRIMNCAYVARNSALDHAVQTLLRKYKEAAYLGISVLWQVKNSAKDKDGSLIRLPLGDYSTLSSQVFEDQVIAPISELLKKSPGSTPLYR